MKAGPRTFWVRVPADYGASPSIAARDRALRTNGCAGSSARPWHHEVAGLETCVIFSDCPAEYPVISCETTGQGNADQHAAMIPGSRCS